MMDMMEVTVSRRFRSGAKPSAAASGPGKGTRREKAVSGRPAETLRLWDVR
jgi:hypothetical protein